MHAGTERTDDSPWKSPYLDLRAFQTGQEIKVRGRRTILRNMSFYLFRTQIVVCEAQSPWRWHVIPCKVQPAQRYHHPPSLMTGQPAPMGPTDMQTAGHWNESHCVCCNLFWNDFFLTPIFQSFFKHEHSKSCNKLLHDCVNAFAQHRGEFLSKGSMHFL